MVNILVAKLIPYNHVAYRSAERLMNKAIDRTTQKPLAITTQAYQKAEKWLQKMICFFGLKSIEQKTKSASGVAPIRCEKLFSWVGL